LHRIQRLLRRTSVEHLHPRLELLQSGGGEREIVLFPSYTPACLAFLASSFFLMVLDFYGLQMAHLTPHSVMLLAIFTHLYEMFIAVQS
jgi:hypothetical protein